MPTLPPRIAYVCTVSGYNQPELEACLLHRPKDLILIVSQEMEKNGAPDRLERVLRGRLPATRIQRLGATTDCQFNGDDLCENQHWIRQVLLPRLHQLAAEGAHCWLNFTGGTKTLSTALLFAYHWDLCEYKPHNSPWLLQYQLCAVDGQVHFNEVGRPNLPSALPLDIARLHNPDCQTRKPNQLEQQSPELTARLANELWHGLTQQDQGLLHLLNMLETLWAEQNPHPYPVVEFNLDWTTLQARDPNLDPATILPWLSRLSQLAPDVVRLNGNHLSLPGPHAGKKAAPWKRWVSGEWLEQHLAISLQKLGIPVEAIGRNLVVTDADETGSHAGREADLLINWQGKTLLIEIKADIPGNSRSIDLEKQISSLGDRFGNTRKILFLGPQLHQKLQNDPNNSSKFEKLHARCQQSKILLLHQIDKLLAEFLSTERPPH